MLPDNLFYDVKDLARDEATSLWGYVWGGRLMPPDDSEYRKVNRELNRLLKRIQKDHGEDALDEALDAVDAVQHDIQADAYKRDRRKLPDPKRPRWASSRKATQSLASSRTLTASDRSSLIRLASTMAKGSPERKALLNGLKVAGKIEIEEGDELIALKDVNVGFPAGIGRDRSGVVRRSSRVRVDYTTRRGDVFCQLIQGQVLLRELDGKTLTRIEKTSWSREPFALRDGHRSRHPYDSGVVESRVWKVLKRKK
jgi:hypothetical protein